MPMSERETKGTLNLKGSALAKDLEAIARVEGRRQVLRILAGTALLPVIGSGLFGCDSNSNPPAGCQVIPTETGGPYPADGTNGPNALTTTGVVRSDIRPSFGSLTGMAEGIPLAIELTLGSASNSCSALSGYAVYLWHCDRDGNYSLYTAPSQNYLRGVQATDASGKVTFMSIFPACYSGRWPHIHFEIFSSLAAATSGASSVKTSQLALPMDACSAVYATTGYAQSVTNLAQVSLTSDNVFSDGSSTQLATVTGDTTAGYTASLTVGV